MTGARPPLFQMGATWAKMLFYNSIISNDQDSIETDVLQLFTHQENSEWISVTCVIIFEVNIVPE